MFVTIINDCNDANALGRQATRASALFRMPVTFIGVANYTTLEAAGTLVDVLDASGGQEGIILVNVAPRHGDAQKWKNGTPFCYFYYQKTLVVASIDKYTLSPVKKLQLVSSVCLLDVSTVLTYAAQQGLLAAELEDYINGTQFRSYDFTPRVAHWIWSGVDIPYERYAISEVPDAPAVVWLVDCFGDCKTTLLPEDVGYVSGNTIQTLLGDMLCDAHLRDVADGETACTIGSSGLGSHRFLEIIVQGESAAEKYTLHSGSRIL